MRLKVIIADDDKNIRMLLKKSLTRIADVEIIGEAANGNEAVRLVEQHECNCVFTDVEMPNGDGVTASKQIQYIQPKIKIVFITAHTEYMPHAFELYAFDYLVKPFKLERLEQTVKRIQIQLRNEKPLHVKAAEVFSKLPKIYLKTREGIKLFDPNDIYIVQRENRLTTLVLKNEKITVNETLTDMEENLPKELFIRSHKSYIINVNHIKNLAPYGRWTHIVKFGGINADALITNDKAKELEEKCNWIV